MFGGKFHCQNITKDPLTLRHRMSLETPHLDQEKWALQVSETLQTYNMQTGG